MKTFRKIIAVLVSALTVFAFAGCDEIIDGSKVTKVAVEIEFYKADGTVDQDLSKTVYFHLYQNNAPKTVKHLTNVIKSGYYDGVAVSDIKSGWFGFGKYTYSDGLQAKSYSGGNVEGEFGKNGFIGQKLSVTSGALVLNRSTENTDSVSAYDSGEMEIIVCTGYASSDFATDSYCVFGKVADDDSLSALQKVTDYASISETVGEATKTTTTYYHDVDGKYYTVEEIDSVKTYHDGKIDGAEITGNALDDLLQDMTDNAKHYLVVPSYKIIIKSMKIVK